MNTCPGSSATRQRISEILLHNNRPSGCIQEKSRWLHPIQSILIDKPLRLGSQRAMNTHHIRPFQHFVDICPFKICPARLIAPSPADSQDVHPEGRSHITYLFPDVSEPDDPDGLARKLHQRKVPKGKIDRTRPSTLHHRI